ncbi:DUF927 domain-containing protein [Paenibacillus amylolyticus]|uniref:DUF927 domain-containing protein n=1 Tax=Paenibacillus amylolyticus TaxID=1451 RepID=UPI0013E3F26C|nr:DUF927 domain-containing protein [Paenibacillus amylolyticus]
MSILQNSNEFKAAQLAMEASMSDLNTDETPHDEQTHHEAIPNHSSHQIDTNKLHIPIFDSVLSNSKDPREKDAGINSPPEFLISPGDPRPVLADLFHAPVGNNIMLPTQYRFQSKFGAGVLVESISDKVNSVHTFKTYLPAPIVITKIFEGDYASNEEQLELAFYDVATLKWRYFIITREALAKESTITQVNKYGYSVSYEKNNSTAKRLMAFLQQFEEQNYMHIPRQVLTTTIGFTENFKEFALYSNNIKINPIGQEQRQQLKNGYVMQGDSNSLGSYVEGIKETLKDYSVPVFCYALSFASPLLKILDAQPFSVEICRNSGYGKSVLQKLALGVWGNPKKLMRPWKTTYAGIESHLEFADGTIVCLEDAHSNEDETIIADVFYMVFNGSGKMRGAKKGGNRLTSSFTGILFSSTETESSYRIHFDGIRRRLIELIAKPYPNKDEAKKAARSAEKLHEIAYGIAGKQWTDFLIANLELQNEWKAAYRDTVERMDCAAEGQGFSRTDLDSITDQNSLLAVVYVTIQLMNSCFGFSFDEDKVMKDITDVVYQQLDGNSKPLVALRNLVHWAVVNEGAHFSAISKSGKQHGVIESGQYIAIAAESVSHHVTKEGFNLSVIDEWKSLGILELESDGKTNPKVKISSHKRQRMMKFKWSELEKYIGEGFYEHDMSDY